MIDADGRRRDLHLKGSGRTPFARGGDGKAAVGPMLREYLIGEAMHALGIPTTRALAVVATGEQVARETTLPGAVLVRVAASHLRVGTFQYAAAPGRPGPRAAPRRPRHRPPPPRGRRCAEPVPGVLRGASSSAQAALVAQWMLVGFVHGVMNTDNMTISGETIDYGPCAFMDAYDPATVFSSIDHGGRYAYGNQPAIAQWNLARFAETLLPLLADDRGRRGRRRHRGAPLVPRPLRPPLGRRAAGQARPGRRRRRRRGPVDGPARAAARPAGRLHRRSSAPCPRCPSATQARRPVRRARAVRRVVDPAGRPGWPAEGRAAVGGRGDGPGEPGLHPAQPPRRGGADRGQRRRPRARSAVCSTSSPTRSTSGPASSATPSRPPTDFGRYLTFCGT